MHQEEKKDVKEQKAQSFARRDRLLQVEAEIQKYWYENHVFEANPVEGAKKFFLNFPYPYANGRLHLGHAFSYTKTDFTARFKRLQGYNVLQPFAFHCTGMPISAAAQKLQRELQQMEATGDKTPVGQYKTLKMMDIPEEEISKFADPYYWLKYFPPYGKMDLMRFGAPVDWRRSFITTDANPYYNSFIEWQFVTLKERGYLKFGKRPSIFSRLDNQMCADHDRREGEGVVPQEYTLIKIKVIQPELIDPTLQGRNVYLVAGTLRPETMYGQTNCFVHPNHEYGIYEMQNNELFVCSERSAWNMAYQGITKTPQKLELVKQIQGKDIIGLQLSAPLTKYEVVYALPMETIKMNKGTGVVTSVPSDAPDDWATLRDLQKKSDYYKVKPEWVNFDPIPIIEVPGYGNLAALKACDEFNVKSQKDQELLKQAKDKVYLLGFYEGVMQVGEFAGKKVQEAKNLVRQKMIEKGEAAIYYEPENLVVSRSGDECVVAHCDQWYLNYSDENWKAPLREFIKKEFQAFNEPVHKALLEALDWIKEWGCSRSFGLGTRLPWDKQYLIESLSDSTLYFAYYTVSHFLQGDMYGQQPGILGIKPEELNLNFWNYIFQDGPYEGLTIPQEKLDIMRKEFKYWYPLDLRCSGKDLIRNHLTFALLNHAAIFKGKPELWPKAYFCNGYILVDGNKMSKQLGNFKTMIELLNDHGADATRLSCADAGDLLEDANFEISKADQGILKITTLENYFQKVVGEINTYRTESKDDTVQYFDEVFENQMKHINFLTQQAFDEMRFRDALKYGFYMLVGIKDDYLIHTSTEGPRKDLIKKYFEHQIVLMSPIVAHFAEYAYQKYLLPILDAEEKQKYPQFLMQYRIQEQAQGEIKYDIIKQQKYVADLIRQIRISADKFKGDKKKKQSKDKDKEKDKEVGISKITIVVARDYYDWQKEVLTLLNSGEIDENGNPKFNYKDQIKANPNNRTQQTISKMMQFASYVLGEYKVRGKEVLNIEVQLNEEQLINRLKKYLTRELKVEDINVVDSEVALKSDIKVIQTAGSNCQPGKPSHIFE